MSAALMLAACGKVSTELVEWTFTASPSTKAAISDSGAFSWNAGDQIGIWNTTTSSFVTFTDAVGKGVYRASAPADAHFTTAIYPASAAAGVSSVTLPAAYASPEASAKAFPMTATVDEASNTLSFKHLGAILSLRITDVTADVKTISVTSADGSISGTFAVADGQIALASGTAGVDFSLSLSEKTDLALTLPMPTGTYEYKVTLGTASDPDVFSATTGPSKQTFERGKIYKPSPVAFVNGSVIMEAGASVESYDVSEDDSAWL